jgi:hypothetical protein
VYVIVQHDIKHPQAAFARGEKLMKNEGAPTGTRVLQFYPATDGSAVTCLLEAESVDAVQGWVDDTLGDASVNSTYAVDADQAFSRQPLGIAESNAVSA